MRVKEIMTKDVASCTPDTKLQEVARMMLECNCGEIPVLENKQARKAVGVITDRDIVCRAVAQGRNPLELTAKDCMSSPAIAVTAETSVDDCCELMEKHQIRRVLVTDQAGSCCGIVAQADLAACAPDDETAKFLREVSQPSSAMAVA